jgi:hypothetical protein
MGNKFELRIEHTSMNVFEQPTLNVRKTIWLYILSEYNFNVKHIKGKENNFFNVLGRSVHLMHATSIYMHHSDLKRRILDVERTIRAHWVGNL